MNDKEYCLKDWLEIVENDERILRFRFQYKNTLVWPFIRYRVYILLANKYINDLQTLKAVTKHTLVRSGLYEALKCIKIGFHTPLFFGKKDILYFTYTAQNVILDDGKKINRIYGKFIEEYKNQTGVIETLGEKKYEKNVDDNVCYLDPISFWIDILSYVSRPNKKDILMAESLVRYLRDECKLPLLDEEFVQLKEKILLSSKRVKYMDKIFPAIFQKIAPKIVFLELGHYGDYMAYLVKILRDMGIKTADIQHGLVSRNHPAYVYSDFLCNSPIYAEYFPDFYLGWGEYWLNKILIPREKILIGNPFFWQQCDSAIKPTYMRKNGDKKTILWLGFNDNDKNIMLLDQFIDISHNAYTIRVRLHPLFQSFKKMYTKYKNNDKIILDESPTIYKAFAKADCVVSEISTAIYEALAIGKAVYVLESEESKCHGTTDIAFGFRSAEELFTLLRQEDNSKRYDKNMAEFLFGEEEGWKVKFKQFIAKIGIF